MYQEKTLEVHELMGKSHFTIGSNNDKIDFKLKSTRITIYYDDSNERGMNFFAELRVYENNQKNTHVINVPIPDGVNKARITFATSLKGYDLQSLTAVA